MHARRVEVFVLAAAGMNAIEAADNVAVNHVDHRLGDCFVQRFKGMHAFLDEHFADFKAFLDDAHLVALLAVQGDHFIDIAHRHHAHAVGAGIGLDDDVGRLVDFIFLVFFADQIEHRGDVGGQAVFTLALMEIDTATDRKCRVDAPRVDADRLGEIIGHFVISGEMVGLAAHRPAGMDRRQHDLFVQALQDGRNAGRQIVVEQDGAGIETLQPEPVFCPDQWL